MSIYGDLLKRAYEAPGSGDGFRVLVDRLWPRGKKKSDLRLDAWAKHLSPSTELRKCFDHDPKRWLEFCKRYKAELKAPEIREAIAQIVVKGGVKVDQYGGAKGSHVGPTHLRSIRCPRLL